MISPLGVYIVAAEIADCVVLCASPDVGIPESIDDYIGEDNSVRVIEEYVEQLDMKQLEFKKVICSSTGRPPYNPKDLLKLYLYGYLNRVRSSQRLEHESARNIEVIWLLKKLKPDFKTIADFRMEQEIRTFTLINFNMAKNFIIIGTERKKIKESLVTNTGIMRPARIANVRHAVPNYGCFQ